MKDFAELMSAIAWPAVVGVAMWWFRTSLKEIADGFAERVRTAKTLKYGKFTLEGLVQAQKQMEVRVSTMAAQQGVVVDKVFARQSQGVGLPDDLRALAKEYMEVTIEDRRERVRRKNELARQMADIVLSQGLSPDDLLKSDSEGVWMAVVSAIAIRPQEGDLESLLDVADRATRLHVRYRTVVALIACMVKQPVPVKSFASIKKALRKMSKDADSPLETVIEQASTALDDLKGGREVVQYM